MDIARNYFRVYVVKTAYSVGLFLSEQIINRKLRGRPYRAQIYEGWPDALDALRKDYSDKIDFSKFQMNRLYEVYPRDVYCAFHCKDFVGITYYDQFHEFASRYFPETQSKVFCKKNLTEREAYAHIRYILSRRYPNNPAIVGSSFRLHQVVMVKDIVKETMGLQNLL